MRQGYIYIVIPGRYAKTKRIEAPGARSRALDEVVAARAVVGDGAGVLAVLVEDDPVRARRAAGVGVEATQDRELLVRAGDGEVEALPVVEGVRVVVAANRLAVLEQAVEGCLVGMNNSTQSRARVCGCWKTSTT